MVQVPNKRYVVLICVVLVSATFIAYEQVRHNEFINYDDYKYVTENPHVNSGITRESVVWAFTTLHDNRGYWHPITWLSHMLDCELFGLNPYWHHLTNLLLHIVNTLLLFCVLKKMTGALWRSAFVAAAFALHPLHVESVAWISERKDVLSAFFWMLTMAAYVRYAQRPGISRYLGVVLVFSLALMAKPMVVTLPFVLLLLDYWPLCRFRWARKNKGENLPDTKSTSLRCNVSSTFSLLAEKIPLLVLSAAGSVVTFIAQQDIGATKLSSVVPLSIRIANAMVSYRDYIVKMVYPTRLAVLYPYIRTLDTYKAAVVLVGISALVFLLARRQRWLTVGWLWYLGTLIPVIGLVQVGNQAMADRYTYLPSIGFFIMLSWGAAELLANWRLRKIGLGISAGLVLVILLLCTRTQVRHWKNDFTLFGHALEVTENNYIMHNRYGVAMLNTGQLDEAVTQFSEALRINPQYSKARKNIGETFLKQGRFNEAIASFNEVLRIKKDWPEVYHNLGTIYAKQGKYDLAIQNYNEALRIKHDYISAHSNLAIALLIKGDIKEAIGHCRQALRLNPTDIKAQQVLKAAMMKLYKSGRQKEENEGR